MKIKYQQKMHVNIFTTRQLMGQKAGEDVENKIVELLAKKKTIRMVLAAAPSQDEVLNYLANSKRIAWSRIIAFHMDEYIGLNEADPKSFSTYLKTNLFNKVSFKEVHLINGKGNAKAEVLRYSQLISEAPIDIACLGIGENGHIAFNDPHVADFSDKAILKKVELDEPCRIQQVNEGCFEMLDDVPKEALTLTIPVLMSADYIFTIVPGINKQEAVYNTLKGPVSTKCPASILQTHLNCQFYFDGESIELVSLRP